MENQHKYKTLYIIGNGFDIYHGIPSKYSDFYNFCFCEAHKNCSIHGHDDCDTLQLLNYTYGSELWSDFENKLGKPDMNAIRAAAIIEQKHRQQLIDECLDFRASNVVERIGGYLRGNFSDWAHSLDTYVRKCNKLLNIGNEKESALYLTFNYTKTLEKVYGISSNQIYHIHIDGNVENVDVIDGITVIDCIYGCKDIDAEIKKNNSDFSETMRIYSDYMRKKTGEIISSDRWKTWFGEYGKSKDVDKICVIGHSLNDIDKPYFLEINKKHPEAKWYVSYHTEKEKIVMGKRLKGLNVGSYELYLM
mgnify:CR=1 FL=1